MVTEIISRKRALHLAVDFSWICAAKAGLSNRAIDTIHADVRAFTDAATPYADTAWVVFGAKFSFHGQPVPLCEELEELADYWEISACRPRVGETIVVKNHQDGFFAGELEKIIRIHYPMAETLVFSGGLTDQCVAWTMASGLRRGYRCLGAANLMFKARSVRADGADARAAMLRHAVENHLNHERVPQRDKLMENFDAAIAEFILRQLKEKPALPLKETPVSLLTENRIA